MDSQQGRTVQKKKKKKKNESAKQNDAEKTF